MQVTSHITIKAQIKDVFEAFSDLSKVEERIKGIQSIELLEGPAMMHVGTKWKETRVMFGKEATEVMWVTELRPQQGYVVEAESHGTHYRSEYTFKEGSDGVTVEMTFKGTPLTMMSKIMGTLMFPFFAGATKKALLADMEDLKRVLEK